MALIQTSQAAIVTDVSQVDWEGMFNIVDDQSDYSLGSMAPPITPPSWIDLETKGGSTPIIHSHVDFSLEAPPAVLEDGFGFSGALGLDGLKTVLFTVHMKAKSPSAIPGSYKFVTIPYNVFRTVFSESTGPDPVHAWANTGSLSQSSYIPSIQPGNGEHWTSFPSTPQSPTQLSSYTALSRKIRIPRSNFVYNASSGFYEAGLPALINRAWAWQRLSTDDHRIDAFVFGGSTFGLDIGNGILDDGSGSKPKSVATDPAFETRAFEISVLNASGIEVDNYTMSIPSGTVDFAVPSTLTSGTLRISSPKILNREVDINATSITLYGGDINEDQSVDLVDYFLMSDTYGLEGGDPGWFDLGTFEGGIDSDLNGDKSVDLLDYYILSDGYGQSGDF